MKGHATTVRSFIVFLSGPPHLFPLFCLRSTSSLLLLFLSLLLYCNYCNYYSYYYRAPATAPPTDFSMSFFNGP